MPFIFKVIQLLRLYLGNKNVAKIITIINIIVDVVVNILLIWTEVDYY